METYKDGEKNFFLDIEDKKNFNLMERGELYGFLQISLLRYLQLEEIDIKGAPLSQKELREKLREGEHKFQEDRGYPKQENFPQVMEKADLYSLTEEFVQRTWRQVETHYTEKQELRKTAEIVTGEYILGKYFEERRMPQWLRSLMIRLLAPKEGVFYDSTAGTGDMIAEAADYRKQEEKNFKIYAQEKEPLLCAVSMILGIFRGTTAEFTDSNDALREPLTEETGTLMKFDYSVAFNPINKKSYFKSRFEADPYRRFHYGALGGKNLDWLYAQHQLATLKKGGTGAIVMFSGSLFNTQYRKIRERIAKAGKISCVISLPPNTLSCTSLPFSIVIFKEDKKEKILMIDAEKILKETRSFRYGEKLNMPEEIADKILEIYKNRQEISQISRLVNVEEVEEGVLFPPRYVEKQYVDTELFGRVWIQKTKKSSGEKTLGEIGDFYRGINTSLSASRSENGEVGILKLADVQQGEMVLDNIDTYQCKENVRIEKYRIQEGDILFSCKGPSVKLCAVPRHEGEILISQTFIGLKVDPELCDSRYLQLCLQSPLGISQLKNRQLNSSIVMLGVKDLETISFPCPSLEEQKKIVRQWEEQEKNIRELEEEIRQYRRLQEMEFYKAADIADRLRFEKE